MGIAYQFIVAHKMRDGKVFLKGAIVETTKFTKNDVINFRLLLNNRVIRVINTDKGKVSFPNNNEIAKEKIRQDKVVKEKKNIINKISSKFIKKKEDKR